MAPSNKHSRAGSSDPEVIDIDDAQQAPGETPVNADRADLKRDVDKVKTKNDRKQEAAKVSLEVLESKIEQAKPEDSETPRLISEINVLDDSIESPENIDRAMSLLTVLGMLRIIANTHGLDCNTPEKLLTQAQSPTFPIRLNFTEMGALNKLKEITENKNSAWNRELSSAWWSKLNQIAARDFGKHTPVIAAGRLVNPAATPTLAPTVISPNKSIIPEAGTLQKWGNWASDHPVATFALAGVAIAGAFAMFKGVKKLFSGDDSNESDDEGKEEKGSKKGLPSIVKWLGGGLGAALTVFAAGRVLGNESVGKFLKEKGFNIDSNRVSQFVMLLSKGEFKKAFEILWEGVDENKDRHEQMAKAMNTALHSDKVKASMVYAFKDKNYESFMEDGWLDGATDWAADGIRDLLGPLAALVPGLDSKTDHEATQLIKAYLKGNADTITKLIPVDSETTIGQVLDALIPPVGGTPTVPGGTPNGPTVPNGSPTVPGAPTAPVSPSSGATAAAGGAAAAGVAIAAAAGKESPSGTGQAPDVVAEVTATNETLSAQMERLTKSRYDNHAARNQIILDISLHPMKDEKGNNSPVREFLVANEALLEASLSTPKIIETVANLDKHINALVARLGKLDQVKDKDERESIDAKIQEINQYKIELVPLIEAHEKAAAAYLEAIRGNDLDAMQKANADLVEAKGPIRDLFGEAFEREGWKMFETLLVTQGITNGWSIIRHCWWPANIAESRASFLFGKHWGKLKAAIGSPIRTLRGAFRREPLLALNDIDGHVDDVFKNIELFEKRCDTIRTSNGDIGQDFFRHYDELTEKGVRLTTHLDRHLAAQDKLLKEALLVGDSLKAQKIAQEMNRISHLQNKLQLDVTKDVVKGWKFLDGRKIANNIIGRGEALNAALRGNELDGGLNKVRNCYREVLGHGKKKMGGTIGRLAKKGLMLGDTKLATAGKWGFFATQLSIGTYLLHDNQTDVATALKQTILLTAPVVGTYHDFKQAVTGRENFTGRQLDFTDRAISAGFGVVGAASDVLCAFGVGLFGEELMTMARTGRGLSKARKAQLIIEAGNDVGKIADIERAEKLIGALKGATAAGAVITVGYIGSAAINMGFNKLGEVDIPPGFTQAMEGAGDLVAKGAAKAEAQIEKMTTPKT